MDEKREWNPKLPKYMDNPSMPIFDLSPIYPVQRDLFVSYRESCLEQGLRTRMSEFYEILNAAIFGGIWNQNRNLLQNGYGHLHLDVICDDKLIDAKAVCVERPLKLRDKQFNQYFLHQGLSKDNRKIVYSICRYGIKKPIVYLKEKDNILDKIVDMLSGNTDFMILLPFSVAINLHDPLCSPCSSRYERDRKTGEEVPDPLTQITKMGLVKLFTSPEDFLTNCGLNSADYFFTRAVLPNGMKMNESPVIPFPILSIEDKDYSKWLEKFRIDNSERIKILEEKVQERYRSELDDLTIKFGFDDEKMKEEGEYIPSGTEGTDIIPF